MPIKAKHFQLHELVCDHIYEKYGEQAWQFIDPRLIITIDWIREYIGRPIYINNYEWGGIQTQSGVRCNLCNLNKSKTDKGEVYMSGHNEGQAGDFSVKGMTAEQVRNWLVRNQEDLPYPIRLEAGVDWVHLDCRDTGQKIYFFNPKA